MTGHHRHSSLLKGIFHRLAFGVVLAVLWLLPVSRRKGPVRRSLWTGTPILTLPVKAAAERRLGVDAHSLAYFQYRVGGAFDYDLSYWNRWPIVRWFLPYVVLGWAVCRYQRFHFFCDRGLLPSLVPRQFNPDELALLRRLGKQVFCWAYGGDVRTQDVARSQGKVNLCEECILPGKACLCDFATGQANIATLKAHVTGLFSMGDMIDHTPGSRNDLFYWPVDLAADGGERFAPCFPRSDSTEAVRVVHAPNHQHLKGTRHLVSAVERLRGRGVNIELRLVEGLSNDEAMRVYRSADIVFDQCTSGFHGYVAIEAMALGKPVMAFIRDPRRYLLSPAECPIVSAAPNEVESALERLALDRPRLRELGMRGRRYVERHFTPEAFAGRLAMAYRDLGIEVTTCANQGRLAAA